jgi:hypothetical protein
MAEDINDIHGDMTMDASDHKTCYGCLFPGVLDVVSDRLMKGQVLSYTVHTPGGIGRFRREVGIDVAEWDRCRSCSEFDHCYKLSMAKLAMETAVANV